MPEAASTAGGSYNVIVESEVSARLSRNLVGELTSSIEALMCAPPAQPRLPEVAILLCSVLLVASSLTAADRMPVDPMPVEIDSTLPFGPAPIDYFSDSADDVIARLQVELDGGRRKLTARGESGYLRDLLEVLSIPVESQSLVFSQTSVNQSLIKPSSPRAIYFNDDVTMAWVPGAASIEITVQDAAKGTIFYTLPQPVQTPVDGPGQPPPLKFRREGRCIACHVSARTLNVPGHIISSFLTDATGRPREGFSSINHATKFAERWGGYYVSGRAPNLIHWGNLIGEEDAARHKLEPTFRGAVDDLTPLVDLSRYPTPHSDIVALLVLNHQMHFHNLVNRVNFEHRLNRRSDAEEQLVRYALMEDEAPLTGPVTGSTTFADVYQSRGPRDENGRTLRQLDLQTRLFKYKVSPLIASRSFQLLPEEVRTRLYKRMDERLAERDDTAPREIVREVIPSWPK